MRKNGLKIVLLSAFAIWVAVGVAAIWGKGGYKDIKIARQKAEEILQDVDRLKAENESLKLEISKLETSPSVYEIHAREKLLMKKPGEIVIYLPSEESGGKAAEKGR